jgi:thiol-disulfide isomerase/thioredoxin
MNNNNSNNKSKMVGIIVVLSLLLLTIVGLAYNNIKQNSENLVKSSKEVADKKATSDKNTMEKVKMNNESMSQDTTQGNEMSQAMVPKPGEFKTYDQSELSHAKDGHSVVLFFNATWCSTCQAAVKEINNNLGSIDPTLHILSVDYDSSSTLRQKYGVQMQHTFVSVNSNGELLKKTTGLKNVTEINNFAKQ